MNPAGLTLRELVHMNEGKQYDNWNHTAAVMCLLANINREKKSKTFSLPDFHPFMKRRMGTVIDSKTIHMLKVFVPEKNREGKPDA